MPATIFQIESGIVVFTLVDPLDTGYLTTWQAPNGATAETAVLADYDPDADSWSCQITSGMLSASANQNDVTVPATFCQPSSVVPQPGETSYSLDVEFLQDVNVSTGLSKYLFENDTAEAYFLLGLNGETDPPRAIGRVRLLAGAFGGPARENLTATVSLPCSRKPSISFGDGTTSIIVTMASAPETSVYSESVYAEPEPVPA